MDSCEVRELVVADRGLDVEPQRGFAFFEIAGRLWIRPRLLRGLILNSASVSERARIVS